jgi:hypothetical protein
MGTTQNTLVYTDHLNGVSLQACELYILKLEEWKVKLSLQENVEARKGVRRRGFHVLETVGSQKAVKL